MRYTKQMANNNRGLLAIITGPPASGKDTIVEGLLNQETIPFTKIVTHTTRGKREQEVDGKDYHFVSETDFLTMVSKGEIIEYVHHGSSWKGTHKNPFEALLSSQENFIWRIDPSRAAGIDSFFIEKFGYSRGKMLIEKSVTLYIDVSDPEILKKRWLERDKNADISEFEKRYSQDSEIFRQFSDKFHHRIINEGNPENIIMETLKILQKHLLKTSS